MIQSDQYWLVPIPQADHDGVLIDSVDRVQAAAAILKDLINAGL